MSLIHTTKIITFFSFIFISYFNLDIRFKKTSSEKSTQTQSPEEEESYHHIEKNESSVIIKKQKYNFFQWK
jgi:hypothetical protein